MCKALRQQLKQGQGPCAPCGETDVRSTDKHTVFHSDQCTERNIPGQKGEMSQGAVLAGEAQAGPSEEVIVELGPDQEK